MMQIRKILVPTDFSVPASKAWHYAIELAEITGAELLLAHVVEPPAHPGSLEVQTNLGTVVADLRSKVVASLDKLRANLPSKVASRSLEAFGRVHVELVELAKRERADLIVMATHGYTGLKHALLGSTTERVVRTAACPVLVVRGTENL